MPTFTAIALDRLIEPGAANSMGALRYSHDSKLVRRRSTPNSRKEREADSPSSKLERGVTIPPNPKLDRGVGVPPNPKLERGVSVPPNPKLERGVSLPPNANLEGGVVIPPKLKLDRRNSTSSATSVVEEKHHWTQISPALYATPESTPLPDSPSSFHSSPYIINHKRRGPRLMKSFSEDNVASCKAVTDGIKIDENGSAAKKEAASVSKDVNYVVKENLESTMDANIKSSGPGDAKEKHLKGVLNAESGSSDKQNDPAGQTGALKYVAFNLKQDGVAEDFVDPQESMSVKIIDENEVNGGGERPVNSTTPMAEFYDAWEELSSESGHLALRDVETELREIRLSLLLEIEKRKQAEETLNNMRNQWQRIREQLSLVGLTLPPDPSNLPEAEQPDDPAADLCQQVYLARFVSNSIGRGIAKAEVEMELGAQIELKNFEIARLWDRLHYYETVNREMSQRNQEVVEMARRLRQRRKRRQKWVWGSIAAAVTVGSAVLAYSYFHGGKGSSSQSPSQASEADR